MPEPHNREIYLVLDDFGERLGRAWAETDEERTDRETVMRDLLEGQSSDPVRVVAFNTAEGWSRDVSEDIANKVLERAFDTNNDLSEDTKRFIDRHVGPGEKRPPAPSVQQVDSTQKKRA